MTIVALDPSHDVGSFSCGVPSLDEWLRRYALTAQQSHGVRVYVAVQDYEIAGFYALAAGSVQHHAAPPRLVRGLAQHPVPVVVLARLAVSERWQGRGFGSSLLIDAVRRTLRVAEEVGVRAMVVDAKDDAAREFYEHFGFVASPTDPRHLVALIKDLRALE